MDLVNLRSNQLKTLIDLIESRGLTSPYTLDDVAEIVDSDSSSEKKMQLLQRLHDLAHEILYVPPKR